jgi:hypothetical protein
VRVPGRLGALWRRPASGAEPDLGDPELGWPFDQAPNAAALTVQSILSGQPILHVAHDADDHGWQFLDGRDVDVDQGRVIGMATALELDPTLREIADLPSGWIARRKTATDPWHREPHE